MVKTLNILKQSVKVVRESCYSEKACYILWTCDQKTFEIKIFLFASISFSDDFGTEELFFGQPPGVGFHWISLHEKCRNTAEVFGLNTSYLCVFSPSAGKYGPELTPYLNTFRLVYILDYFKIDFLVCSIWHDLCFAFNKTKWKKYVLK